MTLFHSRSEDLKKTETAKGLFSSAHSHTSNHLLLKVSMQRLPAADGPLASYSVDTITDSFYFGDTIQLYVFSCGKLIIRQMASMHWWMPITLNEKKRAPELVCIAEAMVHGLGTSGALVITLRRS